MEEERIRVLNMLSNGNITVEEAERLLSALEDTEEEPTTGKRRKYLKINVFDSADDLKPRINLRVPFKLVKWGLRFAPKGGHINIGNEEFTQEEFDDMIEELTQGDIVEIISEEDDKIVKIFVE